MRASIPTLHCDADDCIEWAPDEYGMNVSTINGIQITADLRALGWFSTRMYDWCSEHAAAGRVLAGKEKNDE